MSHSSETQRCLHTWLRSRRLAAGCSDLLVRDGRYATREATESLALNSRLDSMHSRQRAAGRGLLRNKAGAPRRTSLA